jgi:hypothetical protein
MHVAGQGAAMTANSFLCHESVPYLPNQIVGAATATSAAGARSETGGIREISKPEGVTRKISSEVSNML